MKIILLQDIRGIGKRYDVKEVSDGYARNFLLKRNLAKQATEQALNELKTQFANYEKQAVALREKLVKIQEFLKNKPLIFRLKLGDKEKPFGSINKKEIEEKLRELDKESNLEVNLNHPLKTLGEHEVEVTLGNGVAGPIRVLVEKES